MENLKLQQLTQSLYDLIELRVPNIFDRRDMYDLLDEIDKIKRYQ